MDTRKHEVLVQGLPSTCNPAKVKLRFEAKCGIRIEHITVEPEYASVQFTNPTDKRKFRENFPTSIKFGNEDHSLRIISPARSSEVHPSVNHVSPNESSLVEQKNVSSIQTWSSLDKLPDCKSGIIVQSQNQSMTIEDVQNYFTSEEFKGGEIKTVIAMTDGLFIAFENEKVAERIWHLRPHRIKSSPVVVFLKSVPQLYKNKLVIKPPKSSTKTDEILCLLQISSEEQDTLPTVKYCPSGSYLVVYKEDIGDRTLQNIVEEFRRQNPSFHISFLAMTDCIQLKPVPELTDLEIKVLFENKHRTGGGNVTRIDRCDSSLLVYFSSYEEANKIAANFAGKNLELYGMSLTVRLFFHSLYKSHTSLRKENLIDGYLTGLIKSRDDKKKKTAATSKVVVNKIDQYLAYFLMEYSGHTDLLNRQLQGIGHGEATTKAVEIWLNSDNKEQNYEASKVLQRFLKDYTSSRSKVFDEKKRKIIDDKLSGKSDHPHQLLLRWSANDDEVVVAGLKTEVQSFLKSLQPISQDSSFILEPEEIRWLVETGNLEKLEKKHNCILPGNGVYFSGEEREEMMAKKEIKDLLKGLTRTNFSVEKQEINDFLIEAENNSTIYHNVSKIMKEQSIPTILVVKRQTPYLMGSKDYASVAHECLKSALTCVESVEMMMVSPSEQGAKAWRAISELESEGKIRTFPKEKSLSIAGFRDHVMIAKKKLSPFEVKFQEPVKVEKGALQYIERYCDVKKWLGGTVLHEVIEGGILLKGAKEAVEKVALDFIKMQDEITKKTLTFEMLGLTAFIKSDKGKSLLLEISSSHRSVILCRPRPPQNHKASGSDQSSESAPTTGTSEKTSVMINNMKVSVHKRDITQDKNDAIVNVVSPNFDLSEGSLSRSIVEKGGDAIREELEKRFENQIRLTSSGRLPCKKVFHVAFPPGTESTVDCFVNLWTIAEERKCGSISVPAIRTGAGLLASSSQVKFMLRSLEEFRKTKKQLKHLRAIDIVVLEDFQLQDFKKELQSASGVTAKVVTSQPKLTEIKRYVVTRYDENDERHCLKIGSITVAVRRGDITEECNHAIVNSTGTYFDLSKGMVSQQITEKGGRQIQEQVRSVEGKQLRITDAGKLRCQKIIHVVAPSKPSGIGQLLDKILNAAEENLFPSLSIPAIGTGNLKLPVGEVAKAMILSMKKFAESNPLHLKRVDFIIYDPEQVKKFKAAFFEKNTEDTPFDNSNCLEFVIFSSKKDEGKAKKAAEYLQERIKDELSSAILDDKVNNFGDKEDERLEKMGRKLNVNISRSDGEIKIEGLEENRIKAEESVQYFIRQFGSDICPPPSLIWEHQAGGQKWEKFDSKNSQTLEDGYQKFQRNESPAVVRVLIDRKELRVNFKTFRMGNEKVKRYELPVDRNNAPQKQATLPIVDDHFGDRSKFPSVPKQSSSKNSSSKTKKE